MDNVTNLKVKGKGHVGNENACKNRFSIIFLSKVDQFMSTQDQNDQWYTYRHTFRQCNVSFMA